MRCMGEGVELAIPFAVHTAKFGYDWSEIPSGLTRADLDACYRRAIARKPEFLKPGEVVVGVFVEAGRIVAFAIQIANAWDSSGRDAEYGAFAILRREDAAKVDFEALLSQDAFLTPSRNPPAEIVYRGPVSAVISTAEAMEAVKSLCCGRSLPAFDFRIIGAVVSVFGSMRELWYFCRVRTADGERTLATTAAEISGVEPPVGVISLGGLREVSETAAQGSPVEPSEHPLRHLQIEISRPAGFDWTTALIWVIGVLVVVVALGFAFLR